MKFCDHSDGILVGPTGEVGLCNRCGETIKLECVVLSEGRKFYYQATPPGSHLLQRVKDP